MKESIIGRVDNEAVEIEELEDRSRSKLVTATKNSIAGAVINKDIASGEIETRHQVRRSRRTRGEPNENALIDANPS